MAMRVGIVPISGSHDELPELGGDIPLEWCLAEEPSSLTAALEICA